MKNEENWNFWKNKTPTLINELLNLIPLFIILIIFAIAIYIEIPWIIQAIWYQ